MTTERRQPGRRTATSGGTPARRQGRQEAVQWRRRHWLLAGARSQWSPGGTNARPGRRAAATPEVAAAGFGAAPVGGEVRPELAGAVERGGRAGRRWGEARLAGWRQKGRRRRGGAILYAERRRGTAKQGGLNPANLIRIKRGNQGGGGLMRRRRGTDFCHHFGGETTGEGDHEVAATLLFVAGERNGRAGGGRRRPSAWASWATRRMGNGLCPREREDFKKTCPMG
uniref:Uncharacterized protein n=1 Tax=Oryza glaberrima TaxID=4538 RepID=A0A679BCU9_ORYGL|nr:hypothetical protein [Oryza glaberrima]